MKKILNRLFVALGIVMLYVIVMASVAPDVLDAQSSYLWSLNVKNQLRLGDDKIVGDNSFTTTALADTVVITGTLPTDRFFLATNDTLSKLAYTVGSGGNATSETLFVKRAFGGASAASYYWLRIRPY